MLGRTFMCVRSWSFVDQFAVHLRLRGPRLSSWGARKASIRSHATCLCSFWVNDTSSRAGLIQHLWFATQAVLRTPSARHPKAVPSPQFRCKSGTRPQTAVCPSESDTTDSMQQCKTLRMSEGNTISAASDYQVQSETNRSVHQF